MIFKSKRKLWTFVGIAAAALLVIAILAFFIYQNILRTDDIKRDQHRLLDLNKRIHHYIEKGNPIETADDLLTALTKEGSDLYKDLCPDSIAWGYHFWYDTDTQEIVLATYESLSAKAKCDFESNSPRNVCNGFFLLDMANSEENRIGFFFETIKTMKTTDDYKAALDLLSFSSTNANRSLGTALKKRMEATAVINEGGIFTNTDQARSIKNIYIVGSALDEEYVATGRLHHVRSEVDLSLTDVGTVRLPANVKVGEFCFEPFGQNMTLYVDTDDAQTLGDIFSVKAIDGWIVIATGERFRIENNLIKNEDGQVLSVEKNGVREDLVLGYRKPVTDFAIGSNEALSKGEGAVYIDIPKKAASNQNGVLYAAYHLSTFTLNANTFNENVSSEEIIWEEIEDEHQLISVDRKTGTVTLEPGSCTFFVI